MKKLILITTIASLSFAAQVTSNAVVNLEKADQSSLHMALESNQDVYGIQFDIRYNANQIQLSEENIAHMFDTADARSNMSVYSKIKEDGLARVIVFDLGGQALLTADNLENIIKLNYEVVDNYIGSTDVVIENIVAAGVHGSEVITEDSVAFSFDTSGDTTYSPDEIKETKITGNFPNPFNPSTQIKFDLADLNQGLVDVSVYDIQGRKVANLHNGVLSSGKYAYTFDANNLSSGQYFVRISAPGFSDVRPMTFLK